MLITLHSSSEPPCEDKDEQKGTHCLSRPRPRRILQRRRQLHRAACALEHGTVALHRLVLFERAERALKDRIERRRNRVVDPLPVAARVHEARAAKVREVAGDLRLCFAEDRDEVADADFVAAEEVEEAQARAVYKFVAESIQDAQESDGRRVITGRAGSRQAAFIYLLRQLGIPVELALVKSRIAPPPPSVPEGPFSSLEDIHVNALSWNGNIRVRPFEVGRLEPYLTGGFGGLMFRAQEYASPAKTRRMAHSFTT